jgi:hypothetical protein
MGICVDKTSLNACAASSGPSTVMSRRTSALSRHTTSGSNSRSIRVRTLRASARVLEQTIFSAACHCRDLRLVGNCVLDHRLVHSPPAEVGAE